MTNKPWESKQDDQRSANSITNFIIICEDTNSEPIYFKYFETENIKVNCIKNKKSMMQNVISAIQYCEEHDVMTCENGQFCISEGTNVWCVFDRDKEETEEKIQRGNIEFNESIETAKRRGIKVAWSNDAFELWILLHFEDVDLTLTERSYYYERLTEIFRNHENPNEDLQKVLRHDTYSYKRDLKSENNFRAIVRSEIVDKTTEAIDRASALEEQFNSDGLQNHQKAPLTLVHHLVQELIEIGGKEIN
jgi:hypothetical protein